MAKWLENVGVQLIEQMSVNDANLFMEGMIFHPTVAA
jgi:hypothetical protein